MSDAQVGPDAGEAPEAGETAPPHDVGAAPPPSGWEIPRSDERRRSPEMEALAQAFTQLMTAVPEDLQAAVRDAGRTTADAVRALIDALRALLEWLLSILERFNGAGLESDSSRQVHDIPIL